MFKYSVYECTYVQTSLCIMVYVTVFFYARQIRTFTFSILPRNTIYAIEVACAGRGARQQVDSSRRGAIREQAMGYFDYVEQSTRPTSVIWTSPYVDAFGLGELVTIAQPVVIENNR